MPFSIAQVTAPEMAAYNANHPLGAGTNAAEHYTVSPEWSSSGHWSDSGIGGGSNLTDPNWPTSAAIDRYFAEEFTRPAAAATALQAVYLLFDLTAGTADYQTIDGVVVKLLNGQALSGNLTMRAAIDDGQDFPAPTNLLVANWSPAIATGGNRKFLNFNLTAGSGITTFRRYQSVRYARIEIRTDAASFGSILPQIGEVMFTRRRQLGHNPRYPYDPRPSQASCNDFVAESGSLARYVNFYGRRPMPFRFKPAVSQVSGLDEAASIRGLFDDTNGGTLPWLWVESPAVATPGIGPANWCYFPKPELAMPYINSPNAQEVELSALELPVFAALEQG